MDFGEHQKLFMGHTAPDWEMVQSKGEFKEKFTLEGKDDSHNLLSNMVDVRACYKPSEKVRLFLIIYSDFSECESEAVYSS